MKHDDDFYRDFDLENITKEKLLGDLDLVAGLAVYNRKFGKHPLAQDFDILSINNGFIAAWLAEKSYRNGWGETPAAQDLEVLSLWYGDVAEFLARHSDVNRWAMTEAAQDPKIVMLNGGKPAMALARSSLKTGWHETSIAKKDYIRSLNNGLVGWWLDIAEGKEIRESSFCDDKEFGTRTNKFFAGL